MTNIFLNVLQISFNTSLFILAILLIRKIFHDLPKKVHCYLWGLVGLFIICSLLSFGSIINIPSAKETIVNIANHEATNELVVAGIEHIFNVPNMLYLFPVEIWDYITEISAKIWMLGVLFFMGYAIMSYRSLHHQVRYAMKQNDIWICDEIESPFILGIIHPKIIVPSTLQDDELKHVIAHEKMHLKSYDHLFKPIAYLIFVFFWMNPLFWVAYQLFCKDMELACDESVIESLNSESKQHYAQTLLALSISNQVALNCPVAFAEISVKERVKNVLSFKHKKLKISLLIILVFLSLSAWSLLSNPTIVYPHITEGEDVAIRQGILKSNGMGGIPTSTRFYAASHKVLAKETENQFPKTVTYYVKANFGSYNLENNQVVLDSGGSYPMALTFEIVNGTYVLTEYWNPDEGSLYSSSIHQKFPLVTWNDATRVEYYGEKGGLSEDCLNQAKDYFGIKESHSEK